MSEEKGRGTGTELQRYVTPDLRPPRGAYVHAVVHGGLAYCSGQLGIDPVTGDFPDGAGAQTRQALSNLKSVLEGVGSSLDRVLKVTVFLRDDALFAEMDAVFGEIFEGARPARTTVPGISFRPGAHVEIDLIAAVG